MNAGRQAAAAAADACTADRTRLAVLVEGMSDRAAVLMVANMLGRDLGVSGVAVVPMGGTGWNAWASTCASRTWRTS